MDGQPTLFSPSLSLSLKKPQIWCSAWPTQVVDPLVPNQILGFFDFLGKREEEVFCFQELAQALIGADSENLKMRRLPPTQLPTLRFYQCPFQH